MKTNKLPHYDMSDNPTGCCPRFKPEGWDGQDLHLDGKRFVRARTRSLAHVPLNMGSVFGRVQKHMEQAAAVDMEDYIVLSRDLSAFTGEHLFAASKDVPGEDMTTLTGNFITKVFEGAFREARRWHEDMQRLAGEKGATGKPVWFFYTTCPKCAKAYGKNYVVGVAEV